MKTLRVPLLALLAAALPACGGGGGGGSAPPPFKIASSVPAHLGSSVPLRPVLSVRFTRALDAATVLPANITLTTAGPTTLGVTATYESCFNEIRVVPDDPLVASTTYTLAFGAGITDSAGKPFPGESIDFTTLVGAVDDVRPVFAADTAAGTVTFTSVQLSWTASADASAVYDIFLSTIPGCFNFTDPWDTTAAGASGHVVSTLSRSQTYYFVVRARDPEGNTDLNEAEVSARTKTSFSLDVWPLVELKCKACHTGTRDGADEVPSMIMDSAANLYSRWVDVDPFCSDVGNTIPGGAKRVKSGGGAANRDLSFVWNKILSKTGAVTVWCGEPMPDTGSLSPTQLGVFENWILEGALNN